MTPVIPCSFGSVTLLTKTAFSPRKEIHLAKCSVYRRFSKSSVTTQRLFLSQPTSLKLLQNYGGHSSSKNVLRIRSLSAVGTDVATEEQNPAVSDEVSDEIPDVSPEPSATNDASASPVVTPTARSKYPRSTRKSNMPPVKNEELVPGASFTGKVRSIQPFGAFIDFGAFTDGLVHVSKLSDGFVKDVGTVVSVGQEVKVRIVEVNMESSRISLTMRESDDANKPQQRKEAFYGGENERPRTSRRNAARSNQKTSKFVKGQVLDGTVKNLTRSGAFVSLPEGEEGFIPIAEESEGFGNILGSSSLQVGQEVNVRVLRITRGQVTLTMKKEEDVEAINKQLNQGVVHTATNPFVLAFRRNKDISSFLEEREKVKQSAETLSSKPVEEKSDEVLLNESDVPALERSSDVSGVPASEEPTEQAAIVDSASSEVVTEEEVPKSTVAGAPQEDLSSLGASGNSESSTDSVLPEEASIEAKADQEYDGADISPNSLAQGSDTFIESAIPEATNEAVEPATSDNDDNGSVALTTEESDYAADLSVDGTAGEVEEKEAGSRPEIKQEDEVVSRELDANQIADTLVVEENVESQKPAENVVVSATSTGDVLATSSSVEETAQAASDGQSTIAVQDSSSKASISPALVKELREETGAGMMDCKKALAETGGDIIKAQEFLRKKGLASADKKASRATAEGRIGSYIHDNRIGVLIEVNCETDFVSRGDIFKELVDDLAMQVAACPQVQYLVTEDVPEEIVSKEREIEMQKEDLLSKLEQIRSKIVDGRIKKRLDELALLEQAYIKNDKLVVKDLVKQTIATIGENIKVKRFVRYNLGEGLEKKSQDFAAEVAAQTTATAPPQVPKSQPAATPESGETATTVAVSAALVKELREVTGAGMMDCKKALSETGGDLEKAQEYLRKKGLSSADKKSSRLAAEGRISSYIHDSRIGVLIEVNCETDFVARNEKFRELVDDLAMQVVACPQVEFVSIEEIPKSIVSKEKEIEMQREDLKSKPENIREKIVEGRVSKRLGELALLEQPFIKDDNVLVKDLVKQTVAALGENIRVRRFVRFTIGE